MELRFLLSAFYFLLLTFYFLLPSRPRFFSHCHPVRTSAFAGGDIVNVVNIINVVSMSIC
jgi:hypothetical protein